MKGKFFEMPKGMKSAPPQQASLSELWKAGAKKPKKAEAAKAEVVPKQDVEMEDASEAAKSCMNRPEWLRRLAHCCHSSTIHFTGLGE